MLTIGSLFAGVGGLELGLEWAGLGPVLWQVESDEWCRRVLARHWPGVARYDDVRRIEIAYGPVVPRVDLVCGGFPCQDVSGAGARAGLTGSRSGLWSEFARVLGWLRPEWVVVENVASGARLWVDAVVRELGQLGYASLPCPVSAEDVGAPHRRARIFVVARRVRDSDGEPIRNEQQRLSARQAGSVRDGGTRLAGLVGEKVADGDGDGRATQRRSGLLDRERPAFGHHADGSSVPWPWPPDPGDADGWREYLAAGGPEPALRRGAHGLPCGMARRDWTAQLRGAGNAVVPQCAEVVGWIVRELSGL